MFNEFEPEYKFYDKEELSYEFISYLEGKNIEVREFCGYYTVDILPEDLLINLKRFLEKLGIDYSLEKYYKVMDVIYGEINDKVLNYTLELNKRLLKEARIDCELKDEVVIDFEDEYGLKIIIYRDDDDYINGIPLNKLELKTRKYIISKSIIKMKLKFGRFIYEHEEIIDRTDVLRHCGVI